MQYPRTRYNLPTMSELGGLRIQSGPTGTNNGPNSQDLRVPAFSLGLDFPELGDWSALGPDEDDGQGEHDELADHEKIQQVARSYVGHADSYDQEPD